jgi:8-oxo-dGTP diphosphatase
VRPSAYAVVRGPSEEIAVVRTAKGHLLPGGGIEIGESAEQAAAREAMEEGGLILSSCEWLGDAVEIVHSSAENACYEKSSAFFGARLQGIAAATEPDHDLLWLKPECAMKLLSHESHRWAVRRLHGDQVAL